MAAARRARLRAPPWWGQAMSCDLWPRNGITSAIVAPRRDPRAWLRALPAALRDALLHPAPPGSPVRVIYAGGVRHRVFPARRPRRRLGARPPPAADARGEGA